MYNSISEASIFYELPQNLSVLKMDHNQLSGELELPNESHVNWRKTLQQLSLANNKRITAVHRLDSMHNLQVLDLSGNQFTELKDEFFDGLNKLTHLNLSANHLERLPLSIGSLQMLVELDVSKNKLRNIDQEHLCGMHRLAFLNARENLLKRVCFHENNRSLAKIFFGFNHIDVFPENIEHLPALTELEVNDNRLDEIPYEITAMNVLRRLNLNNNDLNDLPPQLGTMKQLTVLTLQGNPLRRIKRSVLEQGTIQLKEYLCKLIPKSETSRSEQLQDAIDYCLDDARYTGKLVLANKKLDQFPSVALSFPSLTVLDVSGNSIPELPADTFMQLESLVVLNVSQNQLKSIPAEIFSLQSLKELYCARNNLRELPLLPSSVEILDASGNVGLHMPSEMSALVSLREAHLAFNKWDRFPIEVVQQCKNLEVLDLDSNLIRVVPAEQLLEYGRKLRYLILSNNNIKQLLPTLGGMTWLERLELQGNPLKTIRHSIIASGTGEILRYLQQLMPTNGVGDGRQSQNAHESHAAEPPTELDEEIDQLEYKIQHDQYMSSAQEYAYKKQLAVLKAKRMRLRRAAQQKQKR
uniref:Leucine-rich repeat-containing protein 40 n=1 Tax=Percolomonas cosmopolitus TaxID=63605 RepID=A0A7S1PI64_9EUKA